MAILNSVGLRGSEGCVGHKALLSTAGIESNDASVYFNFYGSINDGVISIFMEWGLLNLVFCFR